MSSATGTAVRVIWIGARLRHMHADERASTSTSRHGVEMDRSGKELEDPFSLLRYVPSGQLVPGCGPDPFFLHY